jgi:hypothetical protein
VHETGEQFSVLVRFSPREREVLLAGGLIAWLRSGGLRPLNITAGEATLVDHGSPVTNRIPAEWVRGAD